MPPEHHMHLFSAKSQLDTDLEQFILRQVPPTPFSPLLSDPLSPTFMASADNNEPYSPSARTQYREVDLDLSHIQSVPSPHDPETLAHDQLLHEQTDHLASKVSAADDSLTGKPQEDTHNEPQQDQQPNTNTSSSGNENDQATTQIPVQRAIQKSQKKLKRGPYMCKLCRGYGHTSKTCNKRRNPAMLGSSNRNGRKDQFLSTLLAIDEVSRKTPKEQLYLHYESIITAIHQLSLCAYKRRMYQRDKALQALHKCLEAEKVISGCIICYNQASSRLGTVMSGKENMANYAGPIKQHPEFLAVIQETRRCLYSTLNAMKNADCSIRNILSSSISWGVRKGQEPLSGVQLNELVLRHAPQAGTQERTAVQEGQAESACTNVRKPLPYMFQSMPKPDVLNLEDESCMPSAPIDFRDGSHQQIESSFRDIDLFIQDEKE